MSLRLSTFSYTGNAVDNRDIPGGSDFLTKLASTRNQGNNFQALAWANVGDDKSWRPGITQDFTANYIQFAAADPNNDGGIEVGTTNFVNQNTQPYLGWGIGGDASHFFAGSFTGTGVAQTIAGVGFQPDLIIIKRLGATTPGCYRIRSMPDTKSCTFNAVALQTDNILRENADGFDVGAGAQANISGGTMHFVCIKIPTGQGEVGSYSGDSSGPRDISIADGSTPRFVMVQGDAAVAGIWRTDLHAANTSSPWQESQANITDGILSMAAGKFTVEDNARSNATGTDYYYLTLTDETAAPGGSNSNFFKLLGGD